MNELRKRDDILILPPDRGSGFVITNRTDYVNTMEQILADRTKFACDTTQRDMVQVIEKDISMHLEELVKKGILDNKTFSDVVPQGSITARFYVFFKPHNTVTPLRSILSMIGSP